MKVTIFGDLDQVVSFLAPTFPRRQALTSLGTPRARKNKGEIAKRNAIIREQAATLRHAFTLVRYDRDARELADMFLAALVGRSERTNYILEKAAQTILSRQPPHSSGEGGR